MSMAEIVKQIEIEIWQQREDEQKLKTKITEVTSIEFTERAAEHEQ